jgi:outer membrane lipoprotein SlyB
MLRRCTEIRGLVQQAPKTLQHLTWILLLAAVGCQQQAFRVGQRTHVQFGTVTNVDQVNLQSDVPAGALIGGTLGLMTGAGSGNAPRNAIVGAALGAGATAAIQGNRTGIAYTVRMLDGSTIRIISDQREIHVGDCVAIERAGDTNNIRRENPAFCASPNQQAVQAIHEQTEAAAQHCLAAKEELVRATTPEEVNLATSKVNLLCN